MEHAPTPNGHNKLLKSKQVQELTDLSKPTIYRLMKAGNFPRPVKLSPNRVAWRKAEIMAWLDARPVAEGF